MFESLNMMIPFSALVYRSDCVTPPVSAPGTSLSGAGDRPLRRAGAATWDSSKPRHPPTAPGSPKFMWPLWPHSGMRKQRCLASG